MKTLNIGIVAHVDAGKTSLTERLLFHAGVIDKMGSVDTGSTQTDSMELERQRGITIRSAVVSFSIDDVIVNLIDTPGHSDFIAEVERALKVLDGAVLVISAVEGIQPQTRVLMQTLKRLKIPTLIFVNKIDRRGACDETLVANIAQKLSKGAIVMNSVEGLGTRGAVVSSRQLELECLAENNDLFLQAYIDGQDVCLQELAAQTAKGMLHPIFFGSAITGAGIPELVQGIAALLPSVACCANAPLEGSIFKIERGGDKEKIAYARLYSGQIRSRDLLTLYRREASGEILQFSEKVTAVQGNDSIVKIRGLKSARIGDELQMPQVDSVGSLFSLPTLETVIYAEQQGEEPLLFSALQMMAEQDPLINARMDSARQETTVSLYGEVQKEVIQSSLEKEFGIRALFKETKTIYVERLAKDGESLHEIKRKGPNEAYATIGLRVEPGIPGSGIVYRLGVELGSMPKSYHVAVRESVFKTLRKGMHGWEIIDCIVTLTHSGLCPLSTACDYRYLTPLVLMRAIEQAGTYVCEPYSRFELEVPSFMLSSAISKLIELGAILEETAAQHDTCIVQGTMPSNRVHAFEKQLPGLTQGSGVFLSRFSSYEKISSTVPG